jgi:hypothetical protein
MNVLMFATGMIGQGALREALLDTRVERASLSAARRRGRSIRSSARSSSRTSPISAMIALAARGYQKRVLETSDINAIR